VIAWQVRVPSEFYLCHNFSLLQVRSLSPWRCLRSQHHVVPSEHSFELEVLMDQGLVTKTASHHTNSSIHSKIWRPSTAADYKLNAYVETDRFVTATSASLPDQTTVLTSNASYQTQASSQYHGHSRHTSVTQGTMHHSSYSSLYGPNAGSQGRGVPTSPSDKSDR
jgi:hypothetical protein